MNGLVINLLGSVAALLLLGVLMLNSATVSEPVPHRLYAHLIWLAGGVGCALAAAAVDYKKLSRKAGPALLLGLAWLLLVVLFVPGVGVLVNGARRWLPSGGQPSEFAKLALIVWLAQYGTIHQDRMREAGIGFFRPGLLCGLTAGLIFVEPDWGTAILVGTVSLAMLLLAGARWRFIVGFISVALPVLAVLVMYNPVRLARVLSFTDPERFQDGIGWQGWHSVLSIGLGGLWGTLCGEGAHKFGFVPEQQTDFIFSLIGEELGLIGTTIVLILFVNITMTGVRIAWRITDCFGQLLASGVSLLIGLQALINMGVCTSSLPNKGIPLPLISYGGSSLVCVLVLVGLLVSIAFHAPLAPAFQPSMARTKMKPAPARQPHAAAGIELASVLLHRKRTARARFVSWFRRVRAAQWPDAGMRSYQRSLAQPQSASRPSDTSHLQA
jgi:cell division protein FtsW